MGRRGVVGGVRGSGFVRGRCKEVVMGVGWGLFAWFLAGVL